MNGNQAFGDGQSRPEDFGIPPEGGHPFFLTLYPLLFQLLKPWCSEDMRGIDLGCGRGLFPRGVLKEFPQAEIWAADQDQSLLDRGEAELREEISLYHSPEGAALDPKIRWVLMDLSEVIRVPAGYFDWATLINVAGHLHDVALGYVAQKATEMLRRDGALLVVDYHASFFPQIQRGREAPYEMKVSDCPGLLPYWGRTVEAYLDVFRFGPGRLNLAFVETMRIGDHPWLQQRFKGEIGKPMFTIICFTKP